jgi:hypothetical protein
MVDIAQKKPLPWRRTREIHGDFGSGANMSTSACLLTFGKDHVTSRGEQLVVHSAADMPDWQVQQNRQTAIILAGKEIVETEGVRYILDPWPEYIHQIPGRRIRYDAEYVESRDRAEKAMRLRSRQAAFLRPFRIFIGFLPSALKSAIEERYGIPARAATFISIWIELLLFFSAGTLAWVFTLASMYETAVSQGRGIVGMDPVLIFVLLSIFLAIDAVVRYGSYWRDDRSPYGFAEWIFHRRRI